MASDDCAENRATKLRRDSVKTAAIHAGREETVEANCEKQKLQIDVRRRALDSLRIIPFNPVREIGR
jgi:hypothetical protein